MYMWHTKNYLWMCPSHKLNDIYQKYLPHILAPKYKNYKPEHAEKDSHCHAQQEQGQLQ